jgi:hypothetical protein
MNSTDLVYAYLSSHAYATVTAPVNALPLPSRVLKIAAHGITMARHLLAYRERFALWRGGY